MSSIHIRWLTLTSLFMAWPSRAFAEPPSAPAEEEEPPPKPAPGVSTLTLSPTQPEYGEEVTSTTGGSPEQMGAVPFGGGAFEFHGYMRAPMRVGLGPKNDLTPG